MMKSKSKRGVEKKFQDPFMVNEYQNFKGQAASSGSETASPMKKLREGGQSLDPVVRQKSLTLEE